MATIPLRTTEDANYKSNWNGLDFDVSKIATYDLASIDPYVGDWKEN